MKQNEIDMKQNEIDMKQYLPLHLHIHIGHIKLPHSISEILYVIFNLVYAHTDLLDFI